MKTTKLTSKILTFLLVFSMVFSGLSVFALSDANYEETGLSVSSGADNGTCEVATPPNSYYGYDVDYKETDNLDSEYSQTNDKDKNKNLGDEYECDKCIGDDYEQYNDKDKDKDNDNDKNNYNDKDNDCYYYNQDCAICEYCECEYCECLVPKFATLAELVDWEYAMNSALANIAARVANPTFGGEWAVMAIARGNFPVASGFFDRYYESIVSRMATQPNPPRVSGGQSTDTSRVVIALSAIGRDPRNVGGQHNLIGIGGLSDFDWITTGTLNNAIYALIALDTKRYELPEPAANVTTREALINNILSRESITDGVRGGFALFGGEMDPDVTGMAIAALAPYYDSHPNVRDAIDRALNLLSERQLPSGEWNSVGFFGGRNSQSASQIIVALSALGIDAKTDPRFITAEGNNPVTALLAYHNPVDGGFRNQWWQVEFDANSDAIATAQAAYALVAYYRFINGMYPLYDMRDAHGGGSEPNINRFVLNATIVQAQNLTQADFTPASWAALQTALEAAIAVRDNIDATQIEINDATLTLRNAMNALVSYNITVYISFEGASLGHGFYIEPVRMTVPRGSNIEDITRSLLISRGRAYDASWAIGSEFRLERVYSFNAGLANPPNAIMAWLKTEPWREWGMEIPWYFLWSPNGSPDGSLGEGDYFMLSGWLFTVNNELSDIGASSLLLNDGDVVRWQFSLAMGDDFGAEGTWGEPLFPIVDKSSLIRELFAPGINQNAIQRALDTIINPLATANDVHFAIQALRNIDDGGGGGGQQPTPDRAFISVIDPFAGPGQTRVFFSGSWFEIEAGETVYTLLHRTGLNIESRGQLALGNLYVVSINGWGEFSDGPLSGWMYRVNGRFIGGSSGQYPVHNGDRVEWLFTRNLGEDIGDEFLGVGTNVGATQDEEENGLINLDIEVEASVEGGVATAEITANMVRQAIAQLADADEEITGLNFIIVKDEYVTRVEVELTVGVIREMLQNDLSLTIMSDLVTRTFDVETLLGLAYGEANSTRVTVIVEILCAEEADAGIPVNLTENVNNIVNLKVKIGDRIVSEFAGLVRVTLPFVRPIIMPISDTDLLTVYHIGENENIQEMLGAQYRAATMTFSSTHLGNFFVSEWINPFNDVARHDRHLRNVRFVYSSGLMSGVATGEFAPELDLSRAMIATILWRLAGEPAASDGESLYDLQSGRWYYVPANWANTSGVMDGENYLFEPRESVTYGQLVAILLNFAEYQELQLITEENQLRQITAAELTALFDTAQTLVGLSSSDVINRAQVTAILQMFIENTRGAN